MKTALQYKEELSKIPIENLAYSRLSTYVGIQYPRYDFSKHNLMIAAALQKVESGEIPRLILNLPPRHGKTMLTGEFFPAWYLGRNPRNQVIYATYSFERASDVGRKVRNQMIMPIHKQIFKGCTVSKDAAGQNRMTTEQGGYYFAVGTGGVVVGRGANLFIIDDPIKGREEADSETFRRKLIDWYRGVAYTRLMPENAIIIIQTRWHFDDITGYVLEEMAHEGWVVLSLPAVCEDDQDPLRREIGESLWEKHYPRDRLDVIKKTVGTREWNAQYQQHPLPVQGGMIDINWLKRYNNKEMTSIHVAIDTGARPPMNIIKEKMKIRRIVISWDTAFKESQLNDPSAATIWGVAADRKFYLLGIVNKRMKYPTLKKAAIDLWQKYMKWDLGPVPVLIEDKASGQSLIQDLKNETSIPVIAINPDSNKQIRMSAASPLMESGMVYLPDETMNWVVDYETQLARFPLWRHDDLVDSTSQFLLWAVKPKFRKNTKRKFWK
ncbi:MAG TPA: phage terminase large subunit [Dehalococcoidia bacterium]|nr:phage terminase large subunit [Dehalococcoidia bacterium]